MKSNRTYGSEAEPAKTPPVLEPAGDPEAACAAETPVAEGMSKEVEDENIALPLSANVAYHEMTREIQDEGEEFFNSIEPEAWEDKNEPPWLPPLTSPPPPPALFLPHLHDEAKAEAEQAERDKQEEEKEEAALAAAEEAAKKAEAEAFSKLEAARQLSEKKAAELATKKSGDEAAASEKETEKKALSEKV